MIPVLVEIALIIIAYIVGWVWSSKLNPLIAKAAKWVWAQIVKLWKLIWKKK